MNITITTKQYFINIKSIDRVDFCFKWKDNMIYNRLKKIARHFGHYNECLSSNLPFYATQIIAPFLNSRFSANHVKGVEF